MRYCGNDTNLVRDAQISATNVVASDAIYRTDTNPHAGGGAVALEGPYTGAGDTAIDIEIVDNGGSTAQVSQPILIGVGNGAMVDVAAAGLAPQVFAVTLEDLGTETRPATATLQGIPIRARGAGAGGNAITVDVDHSELVMAATQWALQDDLQEGVNEYVGEHWHFGAADLEPSGAIPTSAPRLQFGADPQVYRQYRRYRDGRYVYGFSPAPVRGVARGARVRTVSGARTLTISDGVEAEVLEGLVTLYDALSAIRDTSELVDVDAPIVNDRLPGGQGITELSERTQSYILSVTATGSMAVQYADLQITATPAAPTETLSIRCVDASNAGNEAWEVRGDASGLLPRAYTGVPYADGRYVYTIPLPELDPATETGVMVVEYLPSGTHPEGLPIPSLCVEKPRLGAAAINGSWEYERVKRPPEDCDCATGEMQGGPKAECLGINDTGGTSAVSEESRLIRLQRLTAAVRELVGSNTSPTHSVAVLDVRWIQGSAAIFQECLRALVGGTLALPSWEPETAYEADAMREPTVPTGLRYAALIAGVSVDTEPLWPTVVGDTVVDGSVTWVCIGEAPWKMYDDAFDAWLDEVTELAGIGRPWDCSQWTPDSTLWSSGGLNACYPTERIGRLFRVSASGGAMAATGPLEPAWSTIPGTRVADNWDGGGIQWYTLPAYWDAETSVALGKVIDPGVGVLYRAAAAGVTGETEPGSWGAPSIIDGTVEWEAIASSDLPVTAETTMDVYFEKWRTACTDVLAAAGIERNFDQAGVNGDGCWQDYELPYHWAYTGTEPYMPIQDGHYHHECVMGMDEDGRPYVTSTKRWGFGPRWGCPEALAVGDRLRITISGVTGAGRGYQEGDTFTARANRATPLPLSGGQTGDDTLTWSVIGSEQGRLADYALVTTAPSPYSWSLDDASLAFAILPAGIRFVLGDRYEFAVEGGRFRWRRDGGAWSSPIDIGNTPLADGLTAVFAGGTAPSWVAGDAWSFAAEATFGADQLRQPTDGELEWVGSTTISIEPDGSGETVGLLLVHRIPADATITLQGSNDGFATTPLSRVVPHRRGAIWMSVAAEYAAYRLLVDRGGAARWAWLGTSTQMRLRTGHVELGSVEKRRRMPSRSTPAGLGAVVEHTWLSQESVDALLTMLDHAAENDDGLFGIVPADHEPEAGLVRLADSDLPITDRYGFQRRDPYDRLRGVTLTLEAAA